MRSRAVKDAARAPEGRSGPRTAINQVIKLVLPVIKLTALDQ
jgi:hypothetical protein